MSVVRDMGKDASADKSNVFRQHQQNRLQRFEKLILTYV